ncbi:hypothetical protein [Mucilaginibacter antarcticus]|uniref:hypothetical protein n=1 Tax=Mucilaginibacter antarcticus TaxID=1855725 RepID=UPI00362F79DE
MKYVLKLIFGLLLLQTEAVVAQSKHFIISGVIEFEKSNNMFALMKKKLTKEFAGENKPYYEQYLRTEPQFLKLKARLYLVMEYRFIRRYHRQKLSPGFMISRL